MNKEKFEPMTLTVEITPRELEKNGKSLTELKAEYQEKYKNYNVVLKIVSGLKNKKVVYEEK